MVDGAARFATQKLIFKILKNYWKKDNDNFLKDYLNDLIPCLIDCYIVDKKSIKCLLFCEYEYSSCDSYFGQKSRSLIRTDNIKKLKNKKNKKRQTHILIFS